MRFLGDPPEDVPPLRPLARRALGGLSLLLLVLPLGCSHPAERALQGKWLGESVENFETDDIAAATGWARGTSFLFNGNHVKVTVPAEQPRSGVFRLAAIENRQVSLIILDTHGEESEIDLIVDDAKSLRWMMDDGRAVVLKREN